MTCPWTRLLSKLDKKTKNKIAKLNDEFLTLEEKTSVIFAYFKEATNEEKIYLYIELLKLIREVGKRIG